MKKTWDYPPFLYQVMKITCVQLLLMAAITGLAVARDVNAQELLNRTISIQVENKDLETVLIRLEKAAKVKFSYVPQLIATSNKVSIRSENDRLELILNRLLKPLNITYRVTDNYIVLHKEPTSTRLPDEAPPLASTSIEDLLITGTVTDDKNEPLPGVSILLKGTQRGTSTNKEGSFRLNVPDKSAVLVFSFVGYIAQEVAVGNRTQLNVSLKPDEKSLNEVVVIGYTELSREKLSTSIAKVKGQDINRLPVSTPGEALAGLAAGVQIQAGNGGAPGEAPYIKIRGAGSLGAGNDPLYVVDGYILPQANQFNRVNPSDIESIEILKDAASAAIYGSRAANGVVIVTTKRGKPGQTRFNFDYYTGIQQVAKRMELMNTEQYVKYARETAAVRNVSTPPIFDQPTEWGNTDWQDVIFRSAPISNVQLSASGGSEKVRFSLSGNYLKQEGTLLGSDFALGTLRFNMDADLSKKLRIGISLAPSYETQRRQSTGGSFSTGAAGPGVSDFDGQGVGNAIYNALLLSPVIPARTANGDYGQIGGVTAYSQGGLIPLSLYSPLSTLEQAQSTNNNYRLLGNSYLEWEPVEGLRYKLSVGSSAEFNTRNVYLPATLARGTAQTANLSNPVSAAIYASENENKSIDWLVENTLTYTKNFGKHNLQGFLLYSRQKSESRLLRVNGRSGTYTTGTIQNPSASSDLLGSIAYGSLNAFASTATRITYDYDNKYLFSAAIRRDGSSRFGPDNRFGTFPSMSAGWRITEEPFMASVKGVLSELKLRVSYGETGNASIGDFTWISSVGSSNYSFSNLRTFGTTQSGYENRELTWEKNRQTDIGAEIGLFNNRLFLTVDLYQKRTKGMLFSKQLPQVIGYAGNYQTNIGEIENKGLEFSLTTQNLKKSTLKWTTDFNISFNRSKVLDLGGVTSLNPSPALPGLDNAYQIKVGDPIGNIYGYVISGIFKNQAELDAGPKWVAGSQVGDYRGTDLNGDGIVSIADLTVLGNALPKFTFGLVNRFNFKDFDASLIIQGSYGQSMIYGMARQLYYNSGQYNLPVEFIDNYFLPSDPNRDVKYARPGVTGFTLAQGVTNYILYDASFARIRNLTFGYTIPASLLKKVHIQSLRIYATGQNLFTLTKYPGYNPEESLNGNTVYTPGVDQGNYPVNRTVSIGLNLGF